MLTPGTVLQNRYRIASLLGQGGMGAVYRAWDMRLNIPVAVKEMVPQPGLDPQTLAQLRQQFYQEAQVLARLDHPNLVRVTDFFEEWGNAYLVMNFVEGQSLADRIAAQGPLPEAQVLDWARQLLDALAYCHAQGVVHRDIKPQNIIIRADGRPILVDFGLVKLWDPRDPRTRTVVRAMGTPEYAPPEQWGAGHTDPRSDLYSLGATLYHALTGQAPATATDRTADPRILAPPRSINPSLRPETERAILRAMELAKDARWGSAAEMAAALGAPAAAPKPAAKPAPPQPTRAIPGAPPPAPPARVRIPGWAWALAGLALLLLALCGLWVLGPMRPGTPVPQSVTAISPENADRVVPLARWGKGRINRVVFSPDGRLLAVASSLGIYLYDAGTLEEVRFIPTDAGVRSVAFSPDGQTLASGSDDKAVRLWRAADGTLLRTLEGHTDWVRSVAFSPDGQTLASGSDDHTVRLWRVSDGALLRTLEGHTGSVWSVAFSPDGQTLASGAVDTTVRLWRAADGALLRTLEGHTGSVRSVAFSPDGQTLASGSWDDTVRLWRAADGALLRTLEGHTDSVWSVAFSPDGRLLASGSDDKTVRLWRAADGRLLRTLEGHTAWVRSVAFSPDGRLLASGSIDGTVRLWGVR
jgi:tRNA A-37 threonylcarbamoyl transferase component Bud32